MGDRAAEEIISGDVSTGAKQHIEVATTIARHITSRHPRTRSKLWH